MRLLTDVKGVGEKTALQFEKAGITTIDQLLHFFPKHYLSYDAAVSVADIKGEMTAAIHATLQGEVQVNYVKRMQITRATAVDSFGESFSIVWYHMPYLKNSLHSGQTYAFRGKCKRTARGVTMTQPTMESPEQYEKKTEGLWPVYGNIKGISNAMITKLMRQVLDETSLSDEFLPLSVRKAYCLAEQSFAIRQIHFPDTMHSYEQARYRLVFNEFFLFITALQSMKEDNGKAVNEFVLLKSEETDRLVASLPYTLTKAQMKVWNQILEDMSRPVVMNRLIQGDVGSGKTILAFMALHMTAYNGYQGAMMAPTEVLAEQHYETFCRLLPQIPALLLTGSMTAKQKREAYQKIESGDVSVIIGTHALIQEKVVFNNLALVITDEQHRFGVRQRETFSEKGAKPHILVMSATPIPRTLAIILYGDLDISVIDELPAERLPIKNCVVDTSYRPNAYQFIRKEIEKGHQVYVICPMVEESEGLEAENVIDYCDKLKIILPSFTIEYLHGKMRPKDKNDRMRRFASGEIQILVSTTVVEVGVNVPNATVMMVENAERFGLAGLHQLRGRVGRGAAQSYCIFICSSDKKEAMDRLSILGSTNDGFEIARKDLDLRGPGDFFGVRQSGDFAFAIGDIFTDSVVLERASEAAAQYKEQHLVCTDIENQVLTEEVGAYIEKCLQNVNL